MPFRVGIDLVAVESIATSVRTHGDRYLRRIFTERELADCAGASDRLAARYAAKEATLKVLRPGPDDSVPWNEIEVVRNPAGWVDLALSGRAAELAAVTGIGGFSVSLTHEAEFASAIVIGEFARGDEFD
jgi:holo-[acyl-carrier protein] synthase